MPDEEDLRECLERRYNANAKTFVFSRDEALIVISLLRDRKRIRQGSEIAKKYINQYLLENV